LCFAKKLAIVYTIIPQSTVPIHLTSYLCK